MTSDWIDIIPTDLPLADALLFANDPAAGAIATFLGLTRSETDASGRELVALDYEAYAEMALMQMRRLADQARQRQSLRKIVILHRTGRVAVGQPSVVIAVSSAHRGDAFAACRMLIDGLKAEAAIWKRQVWSDGSASWVEPPKGPV